MVKMDTFYEKDDIIMNFTTNHDENSWKGTVKESFGDAGEVMTVLSYLAPGMPLIYSGQEYDLDHKLKFFEKDSFPKNKGTYFALYSKLQKLKTKNTALNGGKNKASYHRINTSDNKHILAFVREKTGKKIIFIANMSNKTKQFTIDYSGKFTIFKTNKNLKLNKKEVISLPKWGYLLLI
jgi:glycosidase